jgi:hypothetical protein
MVDLMTQNLRCSGPQICFFYFVINQNSCMPLGSMKTETVRQVGSQDVPGVNVRKLVQMAWVPYDFVSDVGDNSQV